MYECMLCIENRRVWSRGRGGRSPRGEVCDLGYIAYIGTFVIYFILQIQYPCV